MKCHLPNLFTKTFRGIRFDKYTEYIVYKAIVNVEGRGPDTENTIRSPQVHLYSQGQKERLHHQVEYQSENLSIEKYLFSNHFKTHMPFFIFLLSLNKVH